MSCSFIPAHIFQNILKTGTSVQKSGAVEALYGIRTFLATEHSIARDFLTKLAGKETAFEGRFVYDAENTMSRPGKLVRKEAQNAHSDKTVNEAFDGSGTTYDFFKSVYGRNSIDDRGMKLVSTVHFGKNYANAFWDGQQMTYGDGDGRIFNSFTSVIDVIGHEISHGVTERTAGLVYRDQPGALNEHFSDVFGSLIKQYSKKQTADKADWLIGEGLFTKNVDGRALRDMKHPGTAYNDRKIGKDPQPDHMSKFVKTSQDQGGVHINSGIPNRAFCNAAMNMGGFAWEKAGKIWYQALTTELGENSQFKDAVNATVKVAGKLYGKTSTEYKAVVDGWNVVGLKPSSILWF